ncbi:hypothetical protein PRIC2_013901 [Phytophthora ramorum]
MRHPCTMLLAAAALVYFDGVSTAAESYMVVPSTQVLSPSGVNSYSTTRLLRIHQSVNNEERGISGPSIELVQGWLKKGMITDDIAGLLTLGKAADDLLTGSLLNAWVSYIKLFNKENPGEKMSMVATLTARFGDEAVATMVEAAKKVPKTAIIAKQVQAEQIQQWLVAGKTPTDVFALLKLKNEGTRLFYQPQLTTWVKYMDEFNTVNPGTQLTSIAILKKYYADDVLAKMIATVRKTSSTSDTAKRLETELLREWFNSMKSPTDILRLLNLHKAGLKASESPLFTVWKNYIQLFNTVDPRFKMDMLEGWLKKDKITEDTFRLLTLGNAADDLLTGSLLNAWVSYIKLFNKENPAEKMSIIATLTARFGDEAVATMVEAAKKVPTSAAIAKQVQAEQIQHWLAAGKVPDDIFVLLKLNKEGTRLFAQPQLNAWVKYMDEFNMAKPKRKTTLLSALSTRYNEPTLVQMMIAAKKVPSTNSLALRLQYEQTRFWLRANQNPADIFVMLKLHRAGDTLLSNPLFGAWAKYTADFRKINPGTEFTTMGTMRNYYKDDILTNMILAAGKFSSTSDLARRLEAELLREWYFAAKSPLGVFRLLNLPNTKLKLLESPLYTVWTNYITYFNKVVPNSKVDLLATLTKVYGESNLSRVLIAAEKVPSTKAAATALQKEQSNRWLVAKRDPTEVYFLWHVDKAAAKSPNRLLYGDYVTAYAKRYGLN